MSLLSDEVDLNPAGNSSEVTEELPVEKMESNAADMDQLQLEPTKDEMERERLQSRYEQLQDDIARLGMELSEKEAELAEVKKLLGITPLTEFKQSMAHGWKVMGDKWKEVKETPTYQKTVTTLSEGGKKVSSGFSAAGTKIKENETIKNVGEKTSSALKRTGSVIKDTGTAIKENETIKSMGTKISGAASSLKEKVWSSSADHEDGSVPNGSNPTKGETVVPDEPSKE